MVQTIDLAPTVLDFFGLSVPKDMQGKILTDVISSDKKVRDYAIFGFFGAHINITDGRYLYMKAPVSIENQPLYEYTLMPTIMRARMNPAQLKNAVLKEDAFPFTKGCPVLKIPAMPADKSRYKYGNKLYDLEKDPEQLHPLDDPQKEVELIYEIWKLMQENEAPEEQYLRLGIPLDGRITLEELLKQQELEQQVRFPEHLISLVQEWEEEALWRYKALANMLIGSMEGKVLEEKLREFITTYKLSMITSRDIYEFMKTVVDEENQEAAAFTLLMTRID